MSDEFWSAAARRCFFWSAQTRLRGFKISSDESLHSKKTLLTDKIF